MKTGIYLLAASLLIGGCGFAALPGPTQKEVTKSDLVGVWQYPADYEETTVTLDLRADDSFTQTIQRSGKAKPQIHTGSWKLEDNSPKLKVLKPVFGYPRRPWVLEDVNWWMVSSYQKGIDVAICGAADDRDPDSCFEMRKLR